VVAVHHKATTRRTRGDLVLAVGGLLLGQRRALSVAYRAHGVGHRNGNGCAAPSTDPAEPRPISRPE